MLKDIKDSIPVLVGVVGVWGAAHYFGAGEIADVVVAVLGYVVAGKEALDFIKGMVTLAIDVQQAPYDPNGPNGPNTELCDQENKLADLSVQFSQAVAAGGIAQGINKVTQDIQKRGKWVKPLRESAGKYVNRVKNKASSWYKNFVYKLRPVNVLKEKLGKVFPITNTIKLVQLYQEGELSIKMEM